MLAPLANDANLADAGFIDTGPGVVGPLWFWLKTLSNFVYDTAAHQVKCGMDGQSLTQCNS